MEFSIVVNATFLIWSAQNKWKGEGTRYHMTQRSSLVGWRKKLSSLKFNWITTTRIVLTANWLLMQLTKKKRYWRGRSMLLEIYSNHKHLGKETTARHWEVLSKLIKKIKTWWTGLRVVSLRCDQVHMFNNRYQQMAQIQLKNIFLRI